MLMFNDPARYPTGTNRARVLENVTRLDFVAGADSAAVVTDITLNDGPEARTREWIEKTDRWR